MINPKIFLRRKSYAKNLPILFFQPVFKKMLWGGNRLRTEMGYKIPYEQTGEAWTVSAHSHGDCAVFTASGNTEYDRRTLSELWEKHKELFGNRQEKEFPLLVKIIDARDNLSVQVHPDDDYAGAWENGALGKTECWYILDCEPGASIIIGHNARTKEELEQMIKEERWEELLCIKNIRPGDFFNIAPGTVHAIQAGTLILETQQSSDITYRLFDYNRVQNGVPRELHLEKSMEVITCPAPKALEGKFSNFQLSDGIVKKKLTRCYYYDINRIAINGSWTFCQQDPFVILGVIDGEGMVDGISIKKGDFFLIPAGYGEYTVTGSMEVIQIIS